MPPASHADRRPHWLAAGVATQAAVLLLDLYTPLGFAHGVLYAPPVLAGLAARSFGGIWLLAVLGVLGTVLGMGLSEGRLPGVDGEYIVLNRVLGVVVVLTAGIAAARLLRMTEHRSAYQQALQQTAALLEVSSRVGGVGGWRVDMPERIPHWSDEVFRLLDQPRGAIPDVNSIIARYAPEHQSRIRAAFEDCALAGRPFDVEVQAVARDGSRRWLRVVGEAVRSAGGAIVQVQGAIQDIERHKATEAAFARSRAEWRLLTESLPMIVWVADANGAVTFMNRYTATYTGVSARQLIGTRWLEQLHPDDRNGVMEGWLAAVASARTHEAEFRVRRRDGAWRHHYARAIRVELPAGGGSRWYGTALDVQDQRDAQQARARLADRLAETMESVTDAIMVIDDRWQFTYVNHQAELILGRSRGELVGRGVWDAFPEARGSIFQQQYERCMRDGVTVRFDAEYRPLGKHFEVSAYPGDGGVAIYFRDVTDARRISEELHHARRLDALGQLTGGVAHDFNNLLTVIIGNAELLAENCRDSPQLQQMAQMIRAAAHRGAEVTQRLLAFARRQALQPRPTDLAGLVDSFVPLLRRTLGEHIAVEIVHPAELWQVLVDPGQLEVALLNLAANARDAMADGGKLTIQTANAELDEDYASRHAEVLAGQYVMLAVTDTGQGIAPDDLPRIFEPFFTTKGLGKGTGLGLAMVYGFVKQSGGHVTVVSEEGHGTTVRVYLPRTASAAVERGNPQERIETPVIGCGQLVLLVEDDESVRSFARRQVESLGYRVIEAAAGLEARRLLEAHADVALLFTDMVMPGGMSGRQLAEAARALRPDLPVLYTSGYSEESLGSDARLGAGMFLLGKPYLRAQLAAKLSESLAWRRGMDHRSVQ